MVGIEETHYKSKLYRRRRKNEKGRRKLVEDNKNKIKRIEIHTPVWMYERWKKRKENAGISSLGGYIRSVMQSSETKLSPTQVNFDPLYSANEAQLKDIKKNLDHLKDEIMAELSPYGRTNIKLQEEIKLQLQKYKELDEFAIADLLHQDPDIIFAVLSYLKSTKQVKYNQNLKWCL